MSEKSVAYFCMEYGLDSTLHTYSGGLGVLAGDILKASKDMGKKVVGVGILWSKGYVEQFNFSAKVINKYYSHNYNYINNLVDEFKVSIGDQEIDVEVYKTESYGNVPLYLIDTNVESNTFEQRQLTSKLYAGDHKQKIFQQVLLGKAGIKALDRLNINPDIIHMNESDSEFAGLEVLSKNLQSFSKEDAYIKTREKIRFTTHTPVEAGNPKFSYQLLQETGVTDTYEQIDFKELGGSPFNTTLACLRISGETNAVSKRHETVAKDMWSSFDKISGIRGITNGVHLPTWQSKRIKQAETDEELWEAHQKEKKMLMKSMNVNIDLNKPLIGFARRFTNYKRPMLLFRNEENFNKLVEKFNIIFAGKAHVADDEGQYMVNQIYQRSEKGDSVIWIENYDMNDAMRLVKGCDIWLSSPVPRKEACSTSVIKAAVNGNLNLSIPDGWCWEAIEDGENGWLYGDDEPIKNREEQDKKDSEALYNTLQEKIIPLYENNRDKWIKMMKKSVETGEKYSARKMIEKYDKKLW